MELTVFKFAFIAFLVQQVVCSDVQSQVESSRQALSDLRSSLLRIIQYEQDDTQSKVDEIRNNVVSISENDLAEATNEVNDILSEVDNAGSGFRQCLENHRGPALQALAKAHASQESCKNSLQDLMDSYFKALQSHTVKLTEDDASVFSQCLVTCKGEVCADNHGNTTACIKKALKEGFSRYYPTGIFLFQAMTANDAAIAQKREEMASCEKNAIVSNIQPVGDMVKQLNACIKSVEEEPPRKRVVRGFGKRFKKFFKKVKDQAKRLCSKIPCQISYTVPLAGK